MFLPPLLAGTVELRKPPKAGRATSYAVRGAQTQIDRYLGKRSKKLRQQRSHVQHTEGHGSRETHQSPWSSSLGLSSVLGCFILAKDVGSAAHKLSSGISQLKAASRADNQPRPEPGLNPTDGF
jgi:hypothetical protein